MDRGCDKRVAIPPAKTVLLDAVGRVFETQHQDLFQLGPRRTCERGARFDNVLRRIVS